MQIIIGADIVPTEYNSELFASGSVSELVGEELLTLLQSSKYKIFNLEVPLTDSEKPIQKNGPALIAPTMTANGYQALGVDCLTLANNHIMDQGEQGLKSTIDALKQMGIAFVGAGNNLSEASAPLIVERDGRKIGIYACAEHEFSIAGEKTPGANPFDPLESLDHIATLKAECDYVIVLYHGGKEHYRYPSPGLQKICRKIVEKGADLVVCQHSHCVGCEEKYQGGTIVYGQGNFLFDLSNSEFWNTSLLITLDEDFRISYVPLKKCNNVVRLASGEDAEKILSDFEKRSEEIKQEGFIKKQYKAYAESMLEQYLFAFSGIRRSFIYKVFDKLSGHRMTPWLLRKKYSKKKRLLLKNFVECEAHREMLLSAMSYDIDHNI